MIDRFAFIFWHYHSGPLLGFNQKLWPKEWQYSTAWKLLACVMFAIEILGAVRPWLPMFVRFGLTLIVFSPQWLYVVAPVEHPVFEFRGYGMAAGISLLLAGLLEHHAAIAGALVLFWAWRSLIRRRILTSPVRFWERAQEEQNGS